MNIIFADNKIHQNKELNRNEEKQPNASKIQQNKVDEKPSNVYTELVKLESQAIVPNAETFECEICMERCGLGEGVILRECVHSFCRQCLSDVIRHCEEPAVSCPAMGCPGTLHEREIKALVNPEEYARWLDRGLAAAESGTRNAFHCRTRDCTGWALCETGVNRFPCPVCKHTNCVPCQVSLRI
jgi:RanBP-type and C3HC4-type zinc finger-containing protein 1